MSLSKIARPWKMPRNGGGWLNAKLLSVGHEFMVSEGSSLGRGWLRMGRV